MPDLRYIPRTIEKALKDYVGQFPAVALTGPRQSGKSTLIKHIFGKTHNFISFDDPLARERAISDPRLFIEDAGDRVIFDEIQYAPQILSYIKMSIDEKRRGYGRFIITGSQQFSLIKNLGDTLAGRVGLLNLLPFSTDEKNRVRFLAKELLNTRRTFEHSCLRGSFPESVINRKLDSDAWYASYLQTYLERDIRTIYNVGDLREFQRFMQLLASRSSQILNLSSMAGDLGVSLNTIKKWLSILEASQIVYALPPYYRNLGKRITKSPKIYFLDIGMVSFLTGIKNKELLFNGPLSGPLFENFVIQETVKYFYNRGIRPHLFYMRTHNKVEVDLIIEKSLELYPFEIKLTKTPNSNMAKPIERMRNIFSKLRIGQGKIISLADMDLPLTDLVDAVNFSSYLHGLSKLI